MPANYQAPMRGDKVDKRTLSQTKNTNLKAESATVGHLLAGKNRDVFTIQPGDTLGRAVEVLRDRRVGALLATDDAGALVGILSERDIVRKLADTPGVTLPKLVDEVMTKEVQTCTEEDDLVSVLRRMTAGKFRHMPVVNGTKLVGMITIGDVITYRLSELEHETLQLKQLIVG
ncbi:MAG: CBS domain-containing protein [Pseudomonadota bacterium]